MNRNSVIKGATNIDITHPKKMQELIDKIKQENHQRTKDF